MNEVMIKRFWSKVEKTETCWLWKASKRNKGYGAFIWADTTGKIIQGRAHRFSWELHFGPIPNGKCVLHKCDISACVNPSHLFIGTKADNNRDMHQKKRGRPGGSKTPVEKCKYKRGKEHHAYYIPRETILNIREDRQLGLSYGCLVQKYKIASGHLWRICNDRVRRNE